MKRPAVYMMTNKRDDAIYTGATSNLIKRVYEHKHHLCKGFTDKYNCEMLVFYALADSMETAIMREKQVKAGSRKKKLKLIENQNPMWLDLYENICI